MADAHHDIEIPQESSVFTPSPSTPLHLSGFLSGDTIQVQGDTGNLEFSVQFNIRNKLTSDNYFHYPDHTNHVFETQDSPISNASSSYMTPITNHEDDQCQDTEINASLHSTDNGISEKEESDNEHNKYTIVTRLRSGVLKPVTSYGASIQENQS
ncbi:hypothetical protein ACH5RR_016932 [Cinchona calisaya]|uniref:Uncharacterized protein n=1 Tax=Cinchona calisaya TaxID=153742 RepID=A0ABD2ZXS9_9GENT